MPVYEIKFNVLEEVQEEFEHNDHGYRRKEMKKVKREREMFALIQGDDQVSALSSILGVWKPPGEIINVHIKLIDKYFQIHVPGVSVKG